MTNKDKRFISLVNDIEAASLPNPNTTLIIEDGYAFFHYMSAVLKNFWDTCKTVHLIMAKRSDVKCRTDMYKSKLIKGKEQQYIVVSYNFLNQWDDKKLADWRGYLTND